MKAITILLVLVTFDCSGECARRRKVADSLPEILRRELSTEGIGFSSYSRSADDQHEPNRAWQRSVSFAEKPHDAIKDAAAKQFRRVLYVHARPQSEYAGKLTFQESNGPLSYEVTVFSGRVIGGKVTNENTDDDPIEIVGGWYDRQKLTLLMQMPGNSISSVYFTQMKQFRRTNTGLTLQRHLYDYGQTQIPEGAAEHEEFKETPDDEMQPPKSTDKPKAPEGASTLQIRQKNGSLYYKVVHHRGRVISGIAFYRNSGVPRAYVVGGWYDDERLVLAFQFKRPYSSRNTYFSHVHQFLRDGDKFIIEHSLFGYGRGSTGRAVHVIDNDGQMEKLQNADTDTDTDAGKAP